MANDRLYNASQALHEAVAEFVAAHAEHGGGHRPILWSLYRHSPDAIVVVERSWVDPIIDLVTSAGEPSHVVRFHEPDEDPTEQTTSKP